MHCLLRFLAVVSLSYSLVSCVSLNEFQAKRPSGDGTIPAAIKLEEHLEGGGSWVIPTSRHRQEVDYKSKLTIIPDKDKLKEISTGESDVLSPIDDEGKLRRNKIQGLLEILSGVEARADAVVAEAAALDALRASGQPLTAQDPRVQAFQDLLGAEARQRDQLHEFLENWAEEQVALTVERESPDFENRVDALFDRFITDENGEDVLLNADAVAAQLNQLIRRSNSDVETVESESAVKFRLRAWLHASGKKEPFPVHIDGYDSIRDHGGVKSPRVSFKMSDRDREQVEQGYRLAKSAAKFVNDVRDRDSELRTQFRGLKQTLETEARKLTEEDSVKAITQAVVDDLKKGLDGALAAEPSRAELEELKRPIAAALKLPEKIAAVEAILGRPGQDAPLQILGVVSDGAAVLRDVYAAATGLFEDDGAKLDVLLTVLRTAATNAADNVRRTALTTLATSFEGSKQKLSEFNDTLKQYEIIQAVLAKISTAKVSIRELASKVDPRVRALNLDAVKPGAISLDKTPAEPGDEIFVLAEILDQENGEDVVVAESSWNFPVQKFGLNNTFSAHLIFVDRLANGDADDPETEFDPAPAVSWTLHYKTRVEPEGDGGAATWDFFNPGIGLNLAALDFEDENFQVGLGAHVTLFNDLLQAGIGYNLNADRDNEYFFVGIGILEALRDLGNVTGLSSSAQ